jgi:hypothetical protein
MSEDIGDDLIHDPDTVAINGDKTHVYQCLITFRVTDISATSRSEAIVEARRRIQPNLSDSVFVHSADAYRSP